MPKFKIRGTRNGKNKTFIIDAVDENEALGTAMRSNVKVKKIECVRDGWYVKHEGKKIGPATPAHMKSYVKSGIIERSTLVRFGLDGEWVCASTVKGLFPGTETKRRETVPSVKQKPAEGDKPVTNIETRPCPFCGENILQSALKCRCCGESIHGNRKDQQDEKPDVLAAALTFFVPGLGQICQGRMSGIIWFLMVLGGYFALIVPGIVLHLMCVIDASRGK